MPAARPSPTTANSTRSWCSCCAASRAGASRRGTSSHALNTRLTALINALHKIGADDRVRDAIRALVEPFLSPIADDIWPKGRPGTAPAPGVVPKAVPIPEGITEIKIPHEEPQKPKPKKETTPEYKARKRWAQHNLARKKKSLPPLAKEAYFAGRR